MKIEYNFNLKDYNSYQIESVCKRAYFPDNENDILDLYKAKKDFILLGGGYNIIFSKEYYDTDFIIFNGNFNTLKIDTNSSVISAEAGAAILDVSEIAEKHSLKGVEFFYDIPSSVGGAVVMNAGTKEGETQNILKKVRYLDLIDMEIKEKNKDDLELEYRNSFFQKQKDKIILKVWFQLSKGDKDIIRTVMEASKKRRWERQPRELPNGGSVFKRPPGRFVGPMIDELGLKGFTIGGAQISKKHSGFIVNINNATGSDILEVIKHAQSKVKEVFNVDLEIEQRII
jgi:UDP-N-acetylmuramate dehydrogenase